MTEPGSFEQFCYDNDILIHYVSDLSTKIRGYCYYDGWYYNIILNDKLCSMQMKKTTVHEIIHIMENHFNCSPGNIEDCENEVEILIKEMRFAWGGC